MEKQMRIELANEYPGGDGYYYASLELPAEEYEIRDALQKIRAVGRENVSPEISVLECGLLPELLDVRLDSPTLDEMNFFAKRLAFLGFEEILAFQAIAGRDITQNNADELVSIKDLINTTYGLETVMIAADVSDDELLGQFVIESELHDDVNSVPDNAVYLLDRKKIGRLQREIDGGIFINDFYIVAGEYERPEIYDGKTLPNEEPSEWYAFRLKIAEAPMNSADETAGSAEWISLPIVKLEADRIANLHNEGCIEDCVYFDFESSIPQITSEIFGDMQDFDKLNALAQQIYAEYLAGASLSDIANGLIRDGILTPRGKTNWTTKGVLSILTNEKYKGDALLQKTYIVDCISKKSKKNTGELPMYYVENNHPAIIERAVFDRVQEEVSRRNSKRKVKDVGTKTELGKYSGKYALTELLFCGNCGTPYRRTTWSKNGKKKIVWRCISRLDYGTKYCKNSPSIEEGVLQNAIAAAITRKAQTEGANVQRIREHIEMYLNRKGNSDLKEKQERLVSLRQRIDELTSMDSESAQNGDFDELFESLYTEMYAIKDELEDAEKTNAKLDTAVNQIDEMTTVMYGLKNHPVEYNEQIVRQLISSIKVVSAEQILILFKDGTEITADL